MAVTPPNIFKPEHLEKVARWKHASVMAALSSGVLFWMLIVRSLRWRRYNAMHAKYGPKWKNGKGTITPQDAQQIVLVSLTYDMPLLITRAVAFVLFKTYAIPTISKLLAATGELKSQERVAKRYADTEILLSTLTYCPISGFTNPPPFPATGDQKIPADDPRCMIALARINYLHGKYDISNDDFLYTLALLVLEPAVWASKWGWREFSPLEKHAAYVLWAEIGRKMGIKGIPEDVESFNEWTREYERAHMVPAQTNHEVAGYTVHELVSAVPELLGLKSFSKRAVICTMDDRLREAMMYPEQPRLLKSLVSTFLLSVNLFQRYFMLPRVSPVVAVDNNTLTSIGEECPRLYPKKWTSRPWYRAEPTGVIDRCRDELLVKIGWFTEMPGAHLRSSGYRIEELGPLKFEHSGQEEVMRMAAELQGCPITGCWSLEGKEEA